MCSLTSLASGALLQAAQGQAGTDDIRRQVALQVALIDLGVGRHVGERIRQRGGDPGLVLDRRLHAEQRCMPAGQQDLVDPAQAGTGDEVADRGLHLHGEGIERGLEQLRAPGLGQRVLALLDLGLERVEREHARRALRELVAVAVQRLFVQFFPALVEDGLGAAAAQVDHRHHRQRARVGLGHLVRHAQHLHDRALHRVFLDIHHLRLEAGHFGRGHAFLHAVAVGRGNAHADAALGLAGADHGEVEVDRLRRRIEPVRLGFDLGIEFVFGQVVRQADRLRFGQHGGNAQHHVLGADAGLAERTPERDPDCLDVDDVAIGNGIAVQQFAGAFFQPVVLPAAPHRELDYLDTGRPDIHADRSPAQKPRQNAPTQGDPLTFELAPGLNALIERA
ncbi:exported hypothetical protein [Cupriavidus phytorum]|uniref:Uncharacterized protein n=1 Tax=Cupriavidus taiwanensis TaxID=164546 RepID=A0A975X767_9BURK|nr:exported hypothetical protein [Cupriavidus taiwanensis]